MKAKLQHVPRYKENLEGVLQIMTKVSEEWVLVETELQDRVKVGRGCKSEGS